MTSIQPNGPSTLFNDDVLAAQNKISSINVDSQIALIWQWLNDLIIALSVTTRDDDTLIDSIVRLRNLHPEVSSIIASAIGWQPKINVRLATIANGNFNTAFADGQTVNGLVLVEDDRILIKDQTAAYRNGIYVVQSSGAPVRATDADVASELGYAYVSVSDEDPTYPNSAWVLTQTSDEITLETTDLTWALAYNVDLSPYILGTGTAGKIALWSTDKILTNSSIREADSRVTVGTAAAKVEIATLQTVSGETGSGGTRSLVENQGNSSGGAGAIFDVYDGATLVSSMEIKVNNAGLTAISSGTTGSRTIFFSDDGTTSTMANPLEIQPPATGTQAVPKNLVALLDGSQAFTAVQEGITPTGADSSTSLVTKEYVDAAVAATGGIPFSQVSVYDASGAFTVGAGTTKVRLDVWGGGMSGVSQTGGASGGYAMTYLTVAEGDVLTITVGAGGAGTSVGARSGGLSKVLRGATEILRATGGGSDTPWGYGSGGIGTVYVGSGETIHGSDANFGVNDPNQGQAAPRGGGSGGCAVTGDGSSAQVNGHVPGGGGGGWDWNHGSSYTLGGGGRVTVTY